jgi:DOPA 4,5-dioxygenase
MPPAPTLPDAPALKDVPSIAGYHAHIYFDSAEDRARALRLREQIAAQFPDALLGRWHDRLVGPHLQPMYQVAFATALFPTFVPWLMLNRNGLTILLHPETGDAYTDHTAHAVWFGAVLPLKLDVLRGA